MHRSPHYEVAGAHARTHLLHPGRAAGRPDARLGDHQARRRSLPRPGHPGRRHPLRRPGPPRRRRPRQRRPGGDRPGPHPPLLPPDRPRPPGPARRGRPPAPRRPRGHRAAVGPCGGAGVNPTLRRRSQRLLAAYPRGWRAANAEVVLDTLLEAAGDQRRWPPLREAAALLRGGVRARVRQAALDPPRRRVVQGLQLGAMLLAMSLPTAVLSWAVLVAKGDAEWAPGLSLTFGVVTAALLLVVALAT